MKLRAALAATAILLSASTACLALPGQPRQDTAALAYQHVWLIVLENRGYEQVIGASADPYINGLAQQYGLATNYYGITHPSEPNYVALLGGSFFSIADDSPFNSAGHTIDDSSLPAQLESVGKTWKAYAQSMPSAGFTGTSFPPGGPDLYASKHTPFLNFAAIQRNPDELAKLVPDGQLATDLMGQTAPNFNFIVPDQCHDMHGLPKVCDDGQTLLAWGDAYVQSTVEAIQNSPAWRDGNTAIVLTWDEDDYNEGPNQGCCGALPGGGHVATIVVTNNGPRTVRDDTPYNHYSLVATLQQVFGVGCLQNTCDTDNVKPMTPLFQT
jgi:phosphatidylinositol-3-phosphatase